MAKTTNFSLNKPDKGTREWHTLLNNNADIIDAELQRQKTEDVNINSRIDTLVSNDGSSNTEIVDARTSTLKSKTFTVLKDRLEELEGETKSLLQPNYSTPVEATSSIISLPSNVDDSKGQLSLGLLGNTRTNLIANGNGENGINDWTILIGNGFTYSNGYFRVAPSDNNFASQLVKVNVGKTYTFKATGKGTIYLYKNALYGEIVKILVLNNTTEIFTFTPTDFTDLIIGMYSNAVAENYYKEILLEEGTVAGNYITGTQSTLDMRVSSVGKNLFDGKEASLGKIIDHNTGNLSDNSTVLTTDYIKVYKDQPISKLQDTEIQRYAYFDTNKKYVSGSTSLGNTFTPSFDGYIKISYRSALIDTIMINYGNTLLPYEQYVSNESFIHLDEPLRSVGSARDEVTEDGEKIQRLGSKILQASDITGYDTSQTNIDWVVIDRTKLIGIYPQQAGVTPNKILIPNFSPCPVYENVDNTAYINTYMDSLSFSASMFLFVPKGTYTSLADAQAKISAQNLEIIYQLTTPITTELEGIGQLQAYPNGTIYVDQVFKHVSSHNEGILLPMLLKSIESVTKMDGSTQTNIDLSNVTIRRLNTTVQAETDTTETTIKITGHGLNVGSIIRNTSRDNAIRKILTVVDANTVTVSAITGMVATDNIELYQSSVTDTQKTAIISITDALSDDIYEIVAEYPSENGTLPTLSYSYPLNVGGQISSNTTQIAQLNKDLIDFKAFTLASILDMQNKIINMGTYS